MAEVSSRARDPTIGRSAHLPFMRMNSVSFTRLSEAFLRETGVKPGARTADLQDVASAAIDPMRTTVLVADSDHFVRAGIRVFLQDAGFSVCAEARDADEAIALATARRPDVCLLDGELAGGSVVATREISRRLPHAAVVVMGRAVDRDGVLDVLRAGAQGYLFKDLNGPALSQALRGAAAGEAVIPRRLVTTILGALDEDDASHATLADGRDVQLTSRERDVARLLQKQMSTAEMAAALGIAAVTVRRHVSSLLRKLGTSDRAVAARLLSL